MGKQAEAKASSDARVRKVTKKQAKQQDKREARTRKKIPNSFRLVGQVYRIFRDNWRKLLGIVLVYLILNVVFASGLGAITSSINSIKDNLQGTKHIGGALSGLGSLVGSAGSTGSSTGAVLQTFLIIIESLVIIWALRQLLAGNSITVKEAYYRSMTPFIPFLLIVFVIVIQLLPVVLGSAVASAILSATYISSGTVTFLFSVIFILLAAWSIYMLSSSIFALYVVTLPEMQPRQALRSAKNLVRYRRWPILRRLLFLPIFIGVVMAIVVLPLILWATFLAAPVFYLLGALAILFAHSYLYSLYRSLLD